LRDRAGVRPSALKKKMEIFEKIRFRSARIVL